MEFLIFEEARRVKRTQWADSAGKGRNTSKSMLRMEGVLNSKNGAVTESVKKGMNNNQEGEQEKR